MEAQASDKHEARLTEKHAEERNPPKVRWPDVPPHVLVPPVLMPNASAGHSKIVREAHAPDRGQDEGQHAPNTTAVVDEEDGRSAGSARSTRWSPRAGLPEEQGRHPEATLTAAVPPRGRALRRKGRSQGRGLVREHRKKRGSLLPLCTVLYYTAYRPTSPGVEVRTLKYVTQDFKMCFFYLTRTYTKVLNNLDFFSPDDDEIFSNPMYCIIAFNQSPKSR